MYISELIAAADVRKHCIILPHLKRLSLALWAKEVS
jgi:hypothetical protein